MREKLKNNETINLSERIIIFIGPEGSGKSTNAQQLANESGIPHLSTGNILREVAANDTGRYGEAVRKMFFEHTYLDGELFSEILRDRLAKEDTKKGFILDGGLRTVAETQNFLEILKTAGRNLPTTVVYLQISRETCFERLVTGTNARKRDDDTIEAINSRLEKFYDQLEERLKIIKNYPGWELIEVDASGPAEEVYRTIRDQLI
jgi:adenylate kinase